MPIHPFESQSIYGLHDPGGEHIMDECGCKGWVLVSEAIGSDPNDHGNTHTNYADLHNRGFKLMVRLNNGYYGPGTLPVRAKYADFAQRCANYVQHLPQVHIWIIGNEMNMTAERPGAEIAWSRGPSPAAAPVARGGSDDGADGGPSQEPTPRELRNLLSVYGPRTRGGSQVINPGETITPEGYVDAYSRCRAAIKSVAGHENDLVLIGSVAPWNDNTGDWIVYYRDILNQLGPGGCDGITIHTYTHGTDPNLINDESKMGPPYENHGYHYNFYTYRDFMHAIPANMRHLPVYLTETDQDGSWEDRGDSSWIQRAYGEIDWWNKQAGNQQIRAMILYRWETHDHFAMKGRGGIVNDFKAAMQHHYTWDPNAVPSAPVQPVSPGPAAKSGPTKPVASAADFAAGQQIFIAGWPNVRKSAGYVNQASGDVLGMALPGTPATISDGPHTQDNLIWWQLETSLEDGTPVQGWVAQTDPAGEELLSATKPDLPEPDIPEPAQPEPEPQKTKTLGELLAEQPTTGEPDTAEPTTEAPTSGPYTGAVYAAGTTVYNCCGEPVNIRQSAGWAGKGQSDVVAMIPTGALLTVEGGPQEVDDLVWWMVSCQDASGQAVAGWVAEATSEGVRLISTGLPGIGSHTDGGPVPQIETAGLSIEKPFQGNYPVSQWWGGNRSFYQDFLYDDVPLLGHNGLDFATWVGTPLISVDEGHVTKVDYEHGGFGHHIIVSHDWGESLYAHLQTVGVPYGTKVKRGQQIGTTGDSGAGAAHLHFGIRLNPYRRTDGWGGFTDPRPFMNPADLVRSRSAHAPVPMAKEIPGRPRP